MGNEQGLEAFLGGLSERSERAREMHKKGGNVTARVLIVDDEESIRITLAEFIKEDGYTVHTAEDAAEALRLMDEHAFDVVVTDIVLPRVNGVALLKMIHERSPDTQVIMLTGDPAVETAAEAVRAGAFDYLTKPVSQNAIRRVVGNAAQIKELTDEKQRLEEENKKYQQHLERMVEERTAALRESEAHYRGIVQYQTECIDRWLPDGTLTFVNDAYCDYYGKSHDEFIGSNWLGVVTQEDRERVQAHVERLKATLTPENPISTSEHREVAATGETRWMQWSDQAIFDEQGDLVEFQSVGRDITQRKLAEEALQREQRLTLTLSRATAAIASVLSLDEVIEQILAELEEIVVADAVNIMLVDSGVARIARARVCAGSTVDLRVVMDQTFSVEETPNLRRMVETRQPVVIEDARSCQDWIALPGEEWLVSYTGVPIVAHNEVIGILNVDRTRVGSSDEKEIERLKIFASTAAVGIENARLHEGLRKTLEDTIRVVGLTTEMRDPYTAKHQQQVTTLACAIAREMSIPEERIEGIHAAGLMHDIGKISIPAEILTKPAELTDLEFGLIKTHPQVAYDILRGIEFPWPIADIVLQHHERMDGSGYPNGLKGDEIMLEARILAVADVVEAMSSHRPYRPARGLDKAIEEIKENAGKLYDPKIVDACLKLFANGVFKFAD